MDIASVPNFPQKAIFFTHFIFIALSAMGHWATNGYLFYNFILIILILWSMHNIQSSEPIQMAFMVNICSIVLDIFYLAFCYPNSYGAAERFSAALAILHLVARPFTTIYMLKILRERGDEPNFLGGIFPAAPRATSYEDIDRAQPPPPPPTNHGANQHSYDFSNVQQI